jgi:4-amino-4-deoxy-L-arabinose transferase-like glycosyltransferase
VFFVGLLSIFRPIAGLDVPENFFWGKHLELGYYKHPPLFAWISHIFAIVFRASTFTNHLICGVLIFVSFVGIYFIAREFLPEERALICVLILEGLSYSGINTRVFNANSVQIPFWILTTLFYIRAIRFKSLVYFGLFGAFLGLGFLGKYFTLLLGFVIFLSFISLKETRDLLKTPLPFFAVLCFFLVISGHIFWLFQNDFLPFEYVKSSQLRDCSFFSCRKPSIGFFALSIASFLPLLIGFFSIVKNVKFKKINFQNPLENVLFFVSILPFVISFFSALILGLYVLSTWSQPMFFFLPIFLFNFFEFEFRKNWEKRLIIYLIVCFFVWCLMILFSGFRDEKFKGQYNRDLKEIARNHAKKWEDEFGRPLKFISGKTFEVGRFFLEFPHTIVIPYNNLRFAPYVKKEDIEREGFILILPCNSDKICINLDEGMEVKEVVLTNLRKNSLYIFIIYKKPLAN